MKKKLKRQKLRLAVKIFAVLFAAWVVLSAAFGVTRFSNEKDKLIETAQVSTLNTWLNVSAYAGVGYYYSSVPSVIHGVVETRESDMQIKLIKSFGNEVIADSNKICGLSFGTSESNYSISGYLDFDRLRASMDDKTYEEICSYLRQVPPEGGEYELSCTEYAQNADGWFEPIKLEIVRSEDWHKWRVDDKTIKEYKLNFEPAQDEYFLYNGLDVYTFDNEGNPLESTADSAQVYVEDYKFEIGTMDRNIIPKDFFTQENREDYIGAMSKEQRKKLDAYYQDASSDNNVAQWQGLDYVVYNEYMFNLPDDPADEYTNYSFYKMYCAKRVRVLDSCKDDIVLTTIALFVIFTVIGAAIYIISWRGVSRQLREEQKRRDMTNALAHDIKTPLFVIGGYAQNLKDNVHTDKRDHYASVILQKTDEVNAMVHRMLEMSKLDSLDYRLSVQSVNFTELVSDLLQSYSILPDGKFIDFDCPEDITVSADRELMKCALENLIDNAVKYSEPDTGIRISADSSGFEISNYCAPISKAELDRLWEPYARADKSRKNGNGLGLSIVKSVCDLHGFKCSAVYKDGRVRYCVKFNA